MHRLSRKYAELTEVRCWCSGSHNYLSLLLPLPAAAAVRGTICSRYDNIYIAAAAVGCCGLLY